MIRRTLLALAGQQPIQHALTTWPISRNVVSRFVAGPSTDDAVRVAGELARNGLRCTLDHLGEDTVDAAQADQVTAAYLDLLRRIGETNVAEYAEVSVKLSAIGQALGADGEKIATDNAREICAAAAAVGTTVTLDMEDHTTTDSTLGILSELRADNPWVGAVLQAYLYRTESDATRLATEGSRVRLCKGAYSEPPSVAFEERSEIDRAYVRSAKILLSGKGYPMLATHDPRLVEIVQAMARTFRREPGSYEFQMLYGVRPEEQLRLSDAGEKVRVYVPYGVQWYGYMMRRMAEKPANLALFLKSLTSTS